MLTTETETRRITRDELYGMVWRTPMSRLAEEFGITGNGLAKICDRLEVPYPPRGYWAKKQAGKPVVAFRLPPRKSGVPQVVDIHPTPARPAPTPGDRQLVVAVAEKVTGITVPHGLDDLHPRACGHG
jgi:hypothetical protein